MPRHRWHLAAHFVASSLKLGQLQLGGQTSWNHARIMREVIEQANSDDRMKEAIEVQHIAISCQVTSKAVSLAESS